MLCALVGRARRIRFELGRDRCWATGVGRGDAVLCPVRDGASWRVGRATSRAVRTASSAGRIRSRCRIPSRPDRSGDAAWRPDARQRAPPRMSAAGARCGATAANAHTTHLVPSAHLADSSERRNWSSGPGARCRDYSRSVSPDRSPNPPCRSLGNGLSTVSVVRRGWAGARGWGSCCRDRGIG